MNLAAFISIILIASIFAHFSQKTEKKNKRTSKLFIGIAYIILVILLGFRNPGSGIDDSTYSYIFQRSIKSNPISLFLETGLEPGYLLLNKCVSIFTNDFQIVILITAIISLLFTFKTILWSKNSLSLFLAIFIFGTIIYPYYFGIIRLSIAMSIVFYSYTALIEGNRNKFILLVLLASSFHYSALIVLLLLILKSKVQETDLRITYAILTILIPISFLLFSKVIIPLLSSRYQAYTINESMNFNIGDIDKILIIILSILFYKNIEKNNKNINVIIFLYSISIILSVCTTFISFGRTQWYFNIIIVLLLPLIIRGMRSNRKTNTYLIIIIPLTIIYGVLYCARITDPQAKIVYFENYKNILIEGEYGK